MHRRRLLPGLCVTLALFGSGCAHEIEAHGNLPTEASLAQIQPGIHSRADVQALLGTPSSTSLFDNEAWFYISNQTTQIAFLKPEELERTVLVVEFDRTGIVSDVIRLNQADGEAISISSRETPSRGTEQSMFQEFFGNLGRFTPSQFSN